MVIENMTKKEFLALPHRKWDEGVEFRSLVIIPGSGQKNKLHDSGYRCMDFVAVNEKGEPFCLLSGCSDVIHIDGIGGYGKDWLEKCGGMPRTIPISGWSIDCLAKSGLLRIWPMSSKMTCGGALSSFEIFALKGERTCR